MGKGKKKAEVVEATQKLVDMMKGKLRKADQIECKRMGSKDANESLQKGFEQSKKCWVATINGVPVICFGVTSVSILNYKGVPWLLGTEGIKKIGIRFVRHSKNYVKEMLEDFDILENYVDVENKISILWLKWCGFNIEEAKLYGVYKKPFHRFWMRKGGVLSV